MEKLSEYAVRQDRITIIKNLSKVTVSVTGPRGGNEQMTRVDGDVLLEMLDKVGGISSEAAWNYVDIVLDGCCKVCGSSVSGDEQICCDCLNAEIIQHKQRCPGNWHPWIVE